MTSHWFKRTNAEYFIYAKKFGECDFIILFLYSDGMPLAGEDAEN